MTSKLCWWPMLRISNMIACSISRSTAEMHSSKTKKLPAIITWISNASMRFGHANRMLWFSKRWAKRIKSPVQTQAKVGSERNPAKFGSLPWAKLTTRHVVSGGVPDENFSVRKKHVFQEEKLLQNDVIFKVLFVMLDDFVFFQFQKRCEPFCWYSHWCRTACFYGGQTCFGVDAPELQST